MAHRLLILFAAPLLAQEFHNLTVIPNSTRTTRGALELRDQDDSAGVALRAPVSLGASYSLEFPATSGLIGDCLKVASSGVLTFGACGATGGWTLTGSELSPSSTDSALEIVRSIDGQNMGSLAKPWAATFARSFQVPDASGTGAKVALNGTSLSGYDASGNQKVQLQFNSGVLSVFNGYIQNLGVAGSNTDAYAIAKSGTLGSSNVRWVMSHRGDGRQLWFYGYDGANFFTTLKLNPTGNSVCVGCTGDATAGYSLDVNGQIITTGLKAQGAGGYVNAAQVEVRDNSTGLHFGFNANLALIVGIPGAARYVSIQDASSNPIMRWYSHVVGAAEPRVQVYGDLRPDVDGLRNLGANGTRWQEGHVNAFYVNQILPRPGNSVISLGADLYPTTTLKIGHSLSRVNQIWVTDLNVSGTCTGCGGGGSKWTESGSLYMHPTTNTFDYEVRPNPANRQNLGGFSTPWNALYTRQITVPNTANTFYRVSLTQGGMDFTTTAGAQSLVLDGGFGTIDVQGSNAAYRLAATSGGSTVYRVTPTLMEHTALAGGGNASLCVNSAGQFYRGTPGC